MSSQLRHSDQVINGRFVSAEGYDFIDILETHVAASECMTIETDSFDADKFNSKPSAPLLGSRFTIIFAPRPIPRCKRRLRATESPWWIPFSGSVFRDLRKTLRIDGSVIDYIDGLAIRGCSLADLAPGDVLTYDIRTPSIESMPWTHTAMSLSYDPATRETNVVVFGRWTDSDGADIIRNLYDRVSDSSRTAFHPFHVLFPFIYGEFARYNSAIQSWDRAAEALSRSAQLLLQIPRGNAAYRQAWEDYCAASRACQSKAAALEKTMCSWWGLLAYLDKATRDLTNIQHNWPPEKSPEDEQEHAGWRNRQMDAAAADIIANIDVLVEWLGKDVVSLRERLERSVLDVPEPEDGMAEETTGQEGLIEMAEQLEELEIEP